MEFDLNTFNSRMGDFMSSVSTRVGDAGKSLQDFGNEYRTNLVSGLAGMAIGGGIGAATTDTEDDTTGWDATKHRLRNALTGSLAGGAVGASAPIVWDKIKPAAPPPPPGSIEKIISAGTTAAVDAANPLEGTPRARVLTGALEGAAGGYVAGRGLDAWRGTGEANVGREIDKYTGRRAPGALTSIPRTRLPSDPIGPLPSHFSNAEHIQRLRGLQDNLQQGAKGTGRQMKALKVSKGRLGALFSAVSAAGVPAASYFFGKDRKSSN